MHRAGRRCGQDVRRQAGPCAGSGNEKTRQRSERVFGPIALAEFLKRPQADVQIGAGVHILSCGMRALIPALVAGVLAGQALAAEPVLHVGSKRFTESYILGEIVAQAARSAGAPAVHAPGLGNTAIVEQALARGAIDVYPE